MRTRVWQIAKAFSYSLVPGGTGQAAIQPAKLRNATIYVTVGSEEEGKASCGFV